MATGYDARQGGRESFAFQPAAPVQGSSGAGGGSRGAQVVGGRSSGQAVVSGPQTDAGPVATGLGQFFEGLMQPYVERKQQEKFFEGYTAAQSGVALDELDKSHKGIGRIFGPTSFEEGAQFYAAKTAINEWQTDLLADMDTLKRLPPKEAAKVIAAKSRSMMTGHVQADQVLQAGILEASGPLLNTIAKTRFEWQQTEAVKQMSSAAASGAKALQGVLSAQAQLADPSDEQTTATQTAIVSFRASMAKPEGMTDESYKGFLYDFMRNQQQAGNFYSVEIMKRAGVYGVLDDDQQQKLEDSHLKYGNRVLGEAALSESGSLITLDTKVKTGQISAIDAGKELARINLSLKAKTGVDIDLFDYDDIRSMAGSVTDVVIASLRRAEDRKWQVEDRERAIEARREDEAREDAEVAAQVQTMAGMGQAATGIAAGAGTKGDYDIVLNNAYRSGNLGMIVKNFENGYTSDFVANAMQAKIANAVGGESYTKDVGVAYQEWQRLYKLRPAAAAAYYGKYHTAFQRFDSLKRGGMGDNPAYIRAFGDPTIHGDADIPPERRKEAREAAAAYVARQGRVWNDPRTWGNYTLNASSQAAKAAALTRQVAIAAKNSDLPTDALAREAEELQESNGSWEEYGEFGWTNRPGTTPLHRLLKVQKEEASKAVMLVLNARLTAAGFSDGAYGDNYSVVRIKGPDGQPMLHVQAIGDDPGESRDVLISLSDLRQSIAKGISETVRANQADQPRPAARRYNGVNPYRRVPGESGAARLARINREVAAGADPVNHQRK